MAPVVLKLEEYPDEFDSLVCVTAQHRDMLDQVLDLFKIEPDEDLDLMKPNQDLFHITTAVLNGMATVLRTYLPDIVLVHGDTTTTMATSLAAFYLHIPVGHVEAGLRTWNQFNPFPEEMNRVVTDSVGTLYFPPTEMSKNNLIKTGVSEDRIFLTGNTVIDALMHTLDHSDVEDFPFKRDVSKRLVLVTVHRRENFGEPMQRTCEALKTLVKTHNDIEMVLPMHKNPNVRKVVQGVLGNVDRVHLIEPMDYEPFCHLMRESDLILTDSGGIQEEAPSLSKPVLVLREETERPEAVEMGTVKLVGTDPEKILGEANKLLTNSTYYNTMAKAANPYGDGLASERIKDALLEFKNNRKRFSHHSY